MVRTLFIGLDGATFHLLDELTRELPGEGITMPFLGRLLNQGFRAQLRSTPNPLTPPAWVSLMTGRSPGTHGVYDFVRFEDKGDEVFFTLYDARDIRAETIWSIVSRHGKRVVSLNFPMMAPPPAVNGCLLPGFTSWKHLRRNSHPEGLYERIKAIPEFDPMELAWDFKRESKIGEEMTQQELEAWVVHHLPRERQWFRIAETLLREERPDLFAVMFDGTDKIQHQTWHVLDPNLRPEEPDADYLRLRALCLDYFRRLDGYIEKLVEMAGPGVQVFLASDHGFTASTHVVRINRFLGEKGYLAWAQHGDSEFDRRREDANFAFLDWWKTLAFCPTPSSNGIYIRVASAPGRPGVRPEDYSAFRERLVADLRAWRLAETGEPVIRDVVVREEAFPGAAMGDAPDLILSLFDHGFVSVRNREPAVVRRNVVAGTHHPLGIFAAAGPGVAAGGSESLSILDVPTILLRSLDLPVPEDFEGRTPDNLFTDRFLLDHPLKVERSQAFAVASDRSEEEISDAEKQKIMDQLRALGYLED